MSKAKFLGDVVTHIGKQSADDGKLLEIGWLAYEATCIPPGTAPERMKEMRLCYFAGCEHLFSMIMGILDPGSEPTARDLSRMAKISAEVDFWRSVLEASFRPTQGNA